MANHFLQITLGDIAEWSPTVSQVRDAVLTSSIGCATLTDFSIEAKYKPTQREVTNIANLAYAAVRAGRVIDFGYLPNAVIKDCGVRGGVLYDAGAMIQPFRDAWLFLHSWDGGLTPEQRPVAVYLVHPIDPPGGGVEISVLEPMCMRGDRVLHIGDRALLYPPNVERAESRYDAEIVPAIWRLLGTEMSNRLNQGVHPQQAAAGNMFDPLMTALLILQVRGVPRETIRAAEKLQRSRIKTGKLPIPPHDRVDASGYVTALLSSLARKGHGASHDGHASPRWHLRRGTVRHYPSGATSIIMDTLVNVDPEVRAAFKEGRMSLVAERAGYEVKP